MSAFLGPIHHWLFHKIEIQQELTEQVIKAGEKLIPELGEEMDRKYGEFLSGTLEEIIDGTNIHGWLQIYISQVEYKLADSVTILMRKYPELLHEIKKIFYKKGEDLSSEMEAVSAAQVYKMVSDSLLDGMPCDHANTVLEEKEDQVIWKRNLCVHTRYWEEVGGDIAYYHILREELIRGLLADTDFHYHKIDKDLNEIRTR